MTAARRPVVVVTHRVHPEVVEILGRRARVVTNDTDGPLPHAALRDRARGADALLAFMPDRVDAALVGDCPRLRIVAGAFKGCDNVDLAACAARGVRVTAVPDLLTGPTAELAVALLLALARRIPEGDRAVRSAGEVSWRPVLYGTGIEGRTVGILGFGAIGRAVAERLRAFGPILLYADPVRAPPSTEWRTGAGRSPPRALLAASDHVIVTAPLTAATRRLVDAEALARMKPGALLVNVGRGSVVDEEAVAAALAGGRLGGYAADVFAMEDLSLPDRPRSIPAALLEHPDRTLFTPHLGSAVAGVRRAIEESAAASILDLLAGREPRNAVDRPGPRGTGSSRRPRRA